MNPTGPTETDDNDSDQLGVLFEASVGRAIDHPDGHAFVEWFAEMAPLVAPSFAAGLAGTPDERRSGLRMLGRLLWNRIPHPDNQFRQRPLPKPERNAACPCGSGRKYKHCCAGMEAFEDPFANFSLLRYVLQRFPRTALRQLPLAGVDLEELAYVAGEWRKGGNAEDSVAVLENVFADVARLDARAERAFDELVECYNDLGHSKLKQRLIERCLAAPNLTLRSAALHRRIAIVADAGDEAEAWRLFAEAQRLQPENPALAMLELSMLADERTFDRLQERGRFWMARLARDRNHDYADLIAHIRELITDPQATVLKYQSGDRPGLLELRRLVALLPAVECHYTLDREGAEGRLLPSAALAAVVAAWDAQTAVAKPDLTMLRSGDPGAWDDAAPGIAWLEVNPLAWQSFEILDDLALAVREAELAASEDLLLVPLLEHAWSQLQCVLERNNGRDCALPWAFLDNRPALRLIASLFYQRCDQQRWREAKEIARAMVLTLNPNDNHGLRDELTRLCLQDGDAREALAVCDRYPDDALGPTPFNRALALFMLGRNDEAGQALRAAMARNPKVLPMLLASKPKPVRSKGAFIEVGGKEEAWLYREAYLPLWENSGALAWARGLARKWKPS